MGALLIAEINFEELSPLNSMKIELKLGWLKIAFFEISAPSRKSCFLISGSFSIYFARLYLILLCSIDKSKSLGRFLIARVIKWSDFFNAPLLVLCSQ